MRHHRHLIPRHDGARRSPAPGATGLPDVQVFGGVVRGVREGNVLSWRGIPYAAPPVGPLRFRAPAPPSGWNGVRDGSRFGPTAPQPTRAHHSRAGAPDWSSEDCLSLNVQAPVPALADADSLPVMVFIHGGGYFQGSSRDFSGQGEGFVGTGRAVYVNFNYRLGPLGYLDFSRYSTAERPIESNLGLRDQVAALEWVQQNIRAFGGDPDRVTVFGESAGGNAVTTLMATPQARGLFARAIAQSAPADAVYPPGLTARWAEEFLSILGDQHPASSRPGPATDPVRDLLLNGSVPDLLAAARILQVHTPEAYPGGFCFAPVIDGRYVPEHPIDAIGSGRAARVPLIIGTNDREGSVFRGRWDILPGSPSRIAGVFSRSPRETWSQMHAAYPGLPESRTAADFGGDYGFWYPSTRVADLHSRFAPVHVYRFDFAPRLLKIVGLDATHGVEMFALFDRTDVPLARMITSLGGREAYARAGQRMRGRWLRFAESGTTSATWPPYDEATRSTLIIESTDHVENDPRRRRRMAWSAFMPRPDQP
ncbi:MAG: carboxylesterase/lipase family protein [Micrococcaceae bacterium]|nr:carboxylesterase/lipase family protein [Micrococcaceae bacterium]